MKFSDMQGVKRIQFLKWGKTISSSGSGVALGCVGRRGPVVLCCGLYFLRQLVWKLKSQWKHSLRRQSRVQYSYDPYSYSQNFDDGFFHDHISPCILR